MTSWRSGRRRISMRMALTASVRSGMVLSRVPSRSNRTEVKRMSDLDGLRTGQFGAHGVDDGLVVGLAEYGGARHESIGAGGAYLGDVLDLDPAVDLEGDGLAAAVLPQVDALAGLPQLAQGGRDEALAAIARVDRHQEYDVELVHDVVQVVQRGGRVEHQARLAAVFFDQRQGAVGMARGLGMKGDDVGAGLGELRNEGVHRLYHQVYVDGGGGVGTQGLAHHRPHGEVGHIVVVHDVQVYPVGPGGDDVAHLFAQAGEVGGQQAGGDSGDG